MPDVERRSWGLLLLAVASVAAVLMLAGTSWIFVRSSRPAPISLPSSCREPVFLAHRSNSLEAASAALRNGFCGIEVDVRWRDGSGLIVAHDRLPETWSSTGSLSLAGLLDSIPQLPSLIWLDFKNLALDNADSAAAYLNELMARHAFYGRVIVEARQPWALWRFHRRAGRALPAYWIPDQPPGLRGFAFETRLTLVLGVLGFSALSVPKWRLTPRFASRYRRFALFTWTCNTPEEVRTAVSRGARIILTDQPAPPTPTAGSAPIKAQ